MRYRDLRNGGTLDILRMTKASDSKWFNVQADHVGYRDQRFYGALNDYGKLKVSFEWNQIPLFFSQDTRTLFTTTTPLGQLRIDDPIQSAAQAQPPEHPRGGQHPGATLRSAAQAQHRRRPGPLQRQRQPRPEPVLQEHVEVGFAALGGHVRLQRRRGAGGPGADAHERDRRRRRVGEPARAGARRLRRLVLPERHGPRLGQPAPHHGFADGRTAPGPHVALARQQHERRERLGHGEPPEEQPGDGVPLGRQLDPERHPDSLHDQHRASDHSARSAPPPTRRPA